MAVAKATSRRWPASVAKPREEDAAGEKDPGQTADAAAALQADQAGGNTARIDQVLWGDALAARYGTAAQNDRVPDLIVLPLPGTIYSKSTKKVSEHGGGTPEDTSVGLLVVNGGQPQRPARTVTTPVSTTQIAPTMLTFLGLDPHKLQSVQAEGTASLPTGT